MKGLFQCPPRASPWVIFCVANLAPCKGKSFKTIGKSFTYRNEFSFFIRYILMLLPLQGALLIAIIPRALPWAKSFCPFRACWVISTIQEDKLGNLKPI